MTLTVKLDEDLSSLVGLPLRAAGYVVRTVADQGWSGLKDAPLWDRLCAESAYFITADKGFGDVRRFPPGTHQGILVLRAERESIVAYRALVEGVIAKYRLESLAGALAVATPRGVRVRMPPGKQLGAVPAMSDTDNAARVTNFIEDIVEGDLRTGKWGGRVHTRFPPEPNGYLHIGHAKSICLNYGLARDYGGLFNLRFDDTNPEKEEQEYVDSIIADVAWLGAEWGDRLLYGSDYFQPMYDWAVELVKKGKAYVCDLTADETRAYRGTLTSPGSNSPYRERSVDENLDLLERMRKGEFPDGSRTLRAKIDMASPNLNLRDPVMYRILHAEHHRQGDAWCIYPMYDWAHGLEDSIEGITHSICTLEFENHRPLYDWFIDAINEGRTADPGHAAPAEGGSIATRSGSQGEPRRVPDGPWGRKIHHPQQIEFARGELTYIVTSKRKLLELVKAGHVRGWDDPRMPTLAGFRRRGYTPEAIRQFWTDVGVAKFNSTLDFGRLEHAIRDDLNKRAPRVMGVLRPLRVVIENYPEGQVEELDAINNPEDPSAGTRKVPFSRVLYIEQDDFRQAPPPKFFRLSPGREVRLRYAYFITCRDVVTDPKTGEVVELRCTYDPATRGGDSPDGRKVKATLHWVSADRSIPAEVRLYEHLFNKPDPNDVPEGGSYLDYINPHSLEVVKGCRLEPSLSVAKPCDRFQFERLGYFCVDADSRPGALVFNRTVTLKDEWAKVQSKPGEQPIGTPPAKGAGRRS